MEIQLYGAEGDKHHPLTDEIVNSMISLEGAVEDFFDLESYNVTYVRCEHVWISRARTVGILNANKLMLSAKNGTVPRRAPIQVKRHETKPDKFVVVDGNSTFINLIFSNYDKVPVIVVD